MTLSLKMTWLRFFLPIIWSGVIYFLSAMPGDGGGGYDFWLILERKSAHIFEYLILVILWFSFFRRYIENNIKAYFLAGGISLIYAFLDEFHQLFVFGRSGKLSDVVIDFGGICLGLVVYFFFIIKKKP